MLKLKHLLHPLRTARVAKIRLQAHLNMRRFASHSRRHFRNDPRYDLQNVTNGFASRFDNSRRDTALLERICSAYAKSVEDQQSASAYYGPTEWWQELRKSSLGPVMQALQDRDLTALGKMYGNFFRDPCATGLVTAPYGMSKAYFRNPIKDAYRHSCMGDALYRIDYWTSETGGRFELARLAGPGIGNPFGVSIQGALVRTGAEYQHYCAHKLLNLLNSERPVVAEIGGGYGGMAYYLLRDGEQITYLDFDVPETIALTSYYLLRAFPSLRFLLYGENELRKESVGTSDVVLMPLFTMAKMPAGSVDAMFSSHAMSDLSPDAMAEYLNCITRMTKNYFLYIGNARGAEMLSQMISRSCEYLRLVETRPSNWNRHKDAKAAEVECLYRFDRS